MNRARAVEVLLKEDYCHRCPDCLDSTSGLLVVHDELSSCRTCKGQSYLYDTEYLDACLLLGTARKALPSMPTSLDPETFKLLPGAVAAGTPGPGSSDFVRRAWNWHVQMDAVATQKMLSGSVFSQDPFKLDYEGVLDQWGKKKP